jgi:hypothetical protein
MSARQNCPNDISYTEKGESPELFFPARNPNHGGHPNNMDIVTQPTENFPIPSVCPHCGGKIHKHGKRDRHVIEKVGKFGTPYEDSAVPIPTVK